MPAATPACATPAGWSAYRRALTGERRYCSDYGRRPKSAQLQRLIARVRDFVATSATDPCTRLSASIVRRRAPRRPDALDDAGSAEMPRPVPAAVQPCPSTLPRRGRAAELYGRNRRGARYRAGGHGRGARYRARTARSVRGHDTAPEHDRGRSIQQSISPTRSRAETAEDTSPEPTAAEAAPISHLEAKRGLDLDASAPVVLFAGDLSYDAGVDILFDAIVTVCGGNQEAQFLFAGDGALRGELQERASRGGLERRCRFLGHVPAGFFRSGAHRLRLRRDSGTRSAGRGFGAHGDRRRQAGGDDSSSGDPVHRARTEWTVAYDNPGSLVWAIRALLGPLYASLRLHLAESAQLESAAVEGLRLSRVRLNLQAARSIPKRSPSLSSCNDPNSVNNAGYISQQG